MGDPFCRGTYPWGHEDNELKSAIRGIIRKRNSTPALRTGECEYRALGDDSLQITRALNGETETYVLKRGE